MSNLKPVVLLGVAISTSCPVFAGDSPQVSEPPAFADIDADGDGALTEDEFLGFLHERMGRRRMGGTRPDGRPNPFAMADANDDGVLSEQEFQAFFGKMRHMRPAAPPPSDIDPERPED